MKKFPFIILLMPGGCGIFSDRKANLPFAISDNEKYWTFEIVFDEKFIGVRSPVFGEGTQVRSPERVPLERISYPGTAYLTQKGSDVEGFVAIEGDTLMLMGIVTETKDGTRWLGLDFEGDRQKEAIHGIMTAALNGNESTGDFLEVGQKYML